MRRSIIAFCFLLALQFSAEGLLAQNPPTNVGREFYLSFPANWTSAQPEKLVQLYIISNTSTEVSVRAGATLIATEMTVPGDIITIDIPIEMAQVVVRNDQAPIPNDQVYPNRGIRISSDDPVTIYAISRVTYTTDGVLALPVEALGREYIIASAPDISDHNTQKLPSQYVVTAAYDNTVLTIINTWDTYGHNAFEPFTVTLMKGDVYSVMAKGQLSDLTGSIISASRPVAVLSGQNCTYLPDRRYAACDYIVEMMLPLSSWGKTYHLVPFAGRLKGDFIRVFSGAAKTAIAINGQPHTTLPGKGGVEGTGWFQILEPERRLLEFMADKPIGVAQYNNSQQYDNVVTDPFFLVLTPVEQYQTSMMFSTPKAHYLKNFISLVMDSSDWNSIEIAPGGTDDWQKLSGTTDSVPQNFPTLIDGVRYAGVSFDIAPGVYSLRGTKPFAGYIYGWSSYDSYGYPMSVAVANLSINDSDAPQIESTQDCLGNVYLTARDMPGDSTRRTNLSTIELHPASYNYAFTPRPVFVPGMADTATFRLKVDDPTRDAMAIIVVSDGRGNTTRDTFYHSEFNMTLSQTTVEFGPMPANGPAVQRTLVVRNQGSTPMTIREVAVRGGDAGFRVLEPAGEVVIDAAGSGNDSAIVTVEFAPSAMGIVSDTLEVSDACGVRLTAILRAEVGVAGVTGSGTIPGLTLGPISPTPTDDVGTLAYQVPSATSVQITLVDISGRTVSTLMQKSTIAAGSHTLRFDVSALPAGSYFCRMSVGERVLVHPIVVR